MVFANRALRTNINCKLFLPSSRKIFVSVIKRYAKTQVIEQVSKSSRILSAAFCMRLPRCEQAYHLQQMHWENG